MPIDICYVLSILYFDSVKGLLWKRSSDVLPVELKSHLAACVFQSCNCAAKKMESFVWLWSRCSRGCEEPAAQTGLTSSCSFIVVSFGLKVFCLFYQ